MPSSSPEPQIPSALVATPGHDSSGLTLTIALLAATLLHVGAITLVSFEPPRREASGVAESALEILILRDAGRGASAPAPDAAPSQIDRSGVSSSGNAVYDEPIGVETVIPDPTETTEPPALDLETLARVEPPPEPAPEVQPEPLPPPDPMAAREIPARDTPVDAAAILASRGEEIDRLTANLQAKTAAYASRVRRKSVSASTREFRYASYLGAWARKVERIGNLNYPQAARDQRMFGSLILHVAVRSDGSVEQIRVVRSSGYDLLDEAAVRIVELAAPYSPFPPDIAAETDVLDIVRTWQFLRGGGLGWEQ